jgi:23S rRNA pseudouridine1911/1915/1917 synthase
MAKALIEIIYSDDNLLVINKPPGTSVTKDRSGKADIIALLEKQLPEHAGKLRLIHRLDKLTSGAMAIALNPETQSTYSSAFEKRLVKKLYLAICTGWVGKEQGTVRIRISRDKKNLEKMRYDKRGKDALTHWQVLAEFGQFYLIAAQPVTGRTHQIRVHLAHIGLPLAIDPLYSGDQPLMLSDIKANYRTSKGKTERPLMNRLTLHAYQLHLPGFEQPFVAKCEKHFLTAVKMLAKHNPKGENAFFDIKNRDLMIEGKKFEVGIRT